MDWIIYRIERPANELNWMRTSTEIVERAAADDDTMVAAIVEAELDAAFEAARQAGWDGEMDEEPHAFVLPAKDEFRFGFVWTCPDPDKPVVIASPLPLPWLED
jgi:hypothetical protein